MYRIISLLSILMLYTSLMFAQGHKGGKTPEMRAKIDAQKISYITQQLEISPEEAQLFWPLYNELKKKKDLLNDEQRQLMKSIKRDSENLTDKEISKISDKLVEIRVSKAQLESDYHYKFKKVLSPKQVMRLHLAEKQFQGMLLRRLRGNGERHMRRGSGSN